MRGLKILAYSKRAGASIIKSVDNRRVFVTGHMEYERDVMFSVRQGDTVYLTVERGGSETEVAISFNRTFKRGLTLSRP